MLATPSPDYVSPKRLRELSTEARKMAEVPYVIDGVLVEVDDVDAHFARARDAGATILSEPADQVRRHPALPGRGPGRAPLDVLAGHRMSRFRYVVADVFTDTPLQGNQVAVFTDAREIPEDKLQPIAKEMNFSETVFVYKPEGDGHARIRIFTPTIEMPFAGHPTLGTAFILSAPLSLEEIKLETGVGLVPVRLEREDGRIVFGRMEQPLPTVEAFDGEDRLLDILGVARAELPVELYDNGVRHVYVCLGSEDEVASLQPDLGRLALESAALGFNCFAGEGGAVEEQDVRSGGRCGRGSGNGVGGRAARAPPGAPRAHRLRRADRDLAGRRDRPPLEALRAGRRLRRRGRARRGRRLSGHGRPRRAQNLTPQQGLTP